MGDKLKQSKKRIGPIKLTKKQKRTQIRVELAILAVLVAIFIFVAYEDYKERPGLLSPDEVVATERTTNSITLSWEDNRNTSKYVLFYKKKGPEYKNWKRVEIENSDEELETTYELKDLDVGTKYRVVVRADNKDRRGFVTEGKYYSTKNNQKIECEDSITKLSASKDFYIDVNAKTPLDFTSTDEAVATVNHTSGKVKIKGEGTTIIKIAATENYYYTEAEKDVKLIVLPTSMEKSSGAAMRIIYSLDEDNCTVVKAVTGDGSIHVPQGLAYTGEKYIIAYGMSNAQRIISFDAKEDGKSVSIPKASMGHPNGFTYCNANGLCYSVRGWSSKVVTYNPITDEYGSASLKYGCSGIAYDRETNKFYTSSRTAMRTYSGDGKFISQGYTGVIKHKGKVYTQDCGGYAGIMFHCLSGSSKHGTNYIDLYDMANGLYIGTLKCDLSEVESAIVDEEGYLEILSNYSSTTDYIYKTPINVKDLSKEINK